MDEVGEIFPQPGLIGKLGRSNQYNPFALVKTDPLFDRLDSSLDVCHFIPSIRFSIASNRADKSSSRAFNV